MPTLSDWQEGLVVSLQHIGQVITNALSWIPNWAGAAIFLALLGLLAWYALRQIGRSALDTEETGEKEEEMITEERHVMKEEPVEY